jgi:hypothetical protein
MSIAARNGLIMVNASGALAGDCLDCSPAEDPWWCRDGSCQQSATQPSGHSGPYATLADCLADCPMTPGSCQGCANHCTGGDLVLTLSGFTGDCAALNRSWAVPYAPLSYQGQVYAPCRWYVEESGANVSTVAIECDAYVALPNEWTITVGIRETGTWPYGGWPIACASTFYGTGPGYAPGKTGPVLLSCGGSHPTGSGPIYTGDAASWYCASPSQCHNQEGVFTIS